MIRDHSEDKLINSIIYFVQNTRYCHKVKLIKLLYFLDFEHFSQSGKSVTGLDYYAWPKGPVPTELFNNIDDTTSEIHQHLEISLTKTQHGHEMLNINPLHEFSDTNFTKREIKLLQSLSDEYANTRANDMIEATHLENLPWHQIYEVEGLHQELIPFELAVKKSETDEVLINAFEHNEFKEHYK